MTTIRNPVFDGVSGDRDQHLTPLYRPRDLTAPTFEPLQQFLAVTAERCELLIRLRSLAPEPPFTHPKN